MPKWFKSFIVTRVSSAAMKSTAAKVSAARGEKSDKVPMGVPTTYNAPRSSLFSSICASSLVTEFVIPVNFQHFGGKPAVFVFYDKRRQYGKPRFAAAPRFQ